MAPINQYVNRKRITLKRVTGGIRRRARKLKSRLEWRFLHARARLSGGTTSVTIGGFRSTFMTPTASELQRVTKIAGEARALTRFVDLIRPGDVVWDVGGNIGTHTVTFAKAVGSSGKIITFEPQEYVFQQLGRNVTLNELSNVTSLQIALGDRKGMGELHVDNRKGSGLHSLLREIGTVVENITIEVGDELVADGRVPQPNLLKIDVEGYEVHVVNGMLRILKSTDCRALICEVHTQVLRDLGDGELQLREVLRNSGFTTFERFTRAQEYHLIATKE